MSKQSNTPNNGVEIQKVENTNYTNLNNDLKKIEDKNLLMVLWTVLNNHNSKIKKVRTCVIAEDSDISIRTAQRKLDKLKELGLIDWESGKSNYESNIYTFNIEKYKYILDSINEKPKKERKAYINEIFGSKKASKPVEGINPTNPRNINNNTDNMNVNQDFGDVPEWCSQPPKFDPNERELPDLNEPENNILKKITPTTQITSDNIEDYFNNIPNEVEEETTTELQLPKKEIIQPYTGDITDKKALKSYYDSKGSVITKIWGYSLKYATITNTPKYQKEVDFPIYYNNYLNGIYDSVIMERVKEENRVNIERYKRHNKAITIHNEYNN